MKYFSRLFFVSLFIFLIGCGDDNITNNNGGNGNPNYTVGDTLFTYDSLAVRSIDTSSVNFISEYISDSTIQGYKITFTGQSNSDSGYIAISFGTSASHFYSWNKMGMQNINSNFELIIDARNQFNYFMSLFVAVYNHPYYCSMKNIKVYRITYN